MILEEGMNLGRKDFSSGRHRHVKEIWTHWGPVRHKMGTDIQGQKAQALELEANSILWAEDLQVFVD